MSLHIAYVVPDQGAVDGPDVSTGLGWVTWGSWVLGYAPRFPEAAHLAQEGWVEGSLDDLAEELDALLHFPPSADLGAVTAHLLAGVRHRPRGAAAVLVTDGEHGEHGDGIELSSTDRDDQYEDEEGKDQESENEESQNPDETEPPLTRADARTSAESEPVESDSSARVRGFHSAMESEPDEDLHRHAYADWLEESVGRDPNDPEGWHPADRLRWAIAARAEGRNPSAWENEATDHEAAEATFQLERRPMRVRQLFSVDAIRSALARNPIPDQYTAEAGTIARALAVAERHAIGRASRAELSNARQEVARVYRTAANAAVLDHSDRASRVLWNVAWAAENAIGDEDGVPDQSHVVIGLARAADHAARPSGGDPRREYARVNSGLRALAQHYHAASDGARELSMLAAFKKPQKRGG